MPRLESSPVWAARQVAGLPPRWRGRLLKRWETTRAAFDASTATGEGDASRRANLALMKSIERLGGTTLPLDAGDAELCAAAERFALDAGKLRDECHHLDKYTQHDELAALCASRGVDAPDYFDTPCASGIARMLDHLWWRRQLRRTHAKQVEAAAIELGYVNRTKDCYASDETVVRRLQQNARNAAMLEATTAVNEDGQEFTLAELAAKSPANKAVRRAELMTRINGFERIAIDMGHVGLFFTITCPSRMHAWKTTVARDGKKGVRRNEKYDGTRPDEAQKYLTKVWARIRAALARRGLEWYGFRIAEPNHDGTPHWHVLVFFASEMSDGRAAMPRVQALVRRYALADSPNEYGAKHHRVDFKPMDPAKGTAAGYIAKYVAKNIDGYKLEKDLYGNDSFETSQRVEAWATTWRIRQFQQVGGPPVTVWRELRRVEAVPATAPECLHEAHAAANKRTVREDRDVASVAWDRYVKAQGGPLCGRDYRVRLATANAGGHTKYGEEKAPRVVGVQVVETYRDGIVPDRARTLVIESDRREWQIVVKGGVSGFQRGESPAWTRVNNCTQGVIHGEAIRAGQGVGQRVGRGGDRGNERRTVRGPQIAAGEAASRVRQAAGDGQNAGEKLFRHAARADRHGDVDSLRPYH